MSECWREFASVRPQYLRAPCLLQVPPGRAEKDFYVFKVSPELDLRTEKLDANDSQTAAKRVNFT